MPVEITELAESIPEVILTSRPLTEAHRLELALFVVFEEVSVRVSKAMIQHAPGADARSFASRQMLEDARHLEQFRRRLDLTLASALSDRASATEAMLLRVLQAGKVSSGTLRRDEVCSAVVIPPLRRYFEACLAFAENGSFLEALVMHDLVLKGWASSLCEFEALYWQPIDPFLSHLIRMSGDDERRHVALAVQLAHRLLGDDPDRRARLARLSEEATALLRDALHYYIRKLVILFGVVRSQHPERYAGVEIAPGELLAGTSEAGQMVKIGMAGTQGVAKVLRQAGLDTHG